MKKLLKDMKVFYARGARKHLPWRRTTDPYRILVSEVMLQQTQVKRVLPFYAEFIRRFPTVRSLAKTPLSSVLAAWQGLGYNRRAKHLHEAAKIIDNKYGHKKQFPTTEELESLPGIGRYTARAIAAFAFNAPEVFIETNIRTVFLHHFYASILQNTSIRKIPDAELLPLVGEALTRSKMEPRKFYAALMDYGAHLKASGVRLNTKSAHYTKQSKFEGSARQLRGAILRELLKKSATTEALMKNLSRERGEVERETKRLRAEGFLQKRGGRWMVD